MTVQLFVHFCVLITLTRCPFILSCTGLKGVPSVPVPIGGGGGHRDHCLHWDGKVALTASSNETKKVYELEIGDRVLAYTSERGFYLSPVVAVLYRDLIEVRDFVRFTTSSGKEVALTVAHGVYTGPCGQENWKEKRVDALTLGECVKTASGQEDRVVQANFFTDVGAVQPITESGSIVVDDVVLSCYDYEKENEKEARKTKVDPHEKLEPSRLLYSLGENLYKGLRESRFAVGVLETLIRSTGLEKLYAA